MYITDIAAWEAEHTYRVSFERTGEQHFDFGVNDKFGRRIGARIYLGVAKFAPYAERPADMQYASAYKVPVGEQLILNVHATRNGKAYGAYQGEKHFASGEAREAAVSKYLAAARKRAGA